MDSSKETPAPKADNARIARLFDEVADFLELGDENPFRVRAYRNAARLIGDLTEPVAAVAKDPQRKLTDLPGIGKDLAEKIRGIVTTGKLPLHDELARKIPPGLRAVMALPGLGPKKARKLNEALRIGSLEELKAAAAMHKVREVKGFGKKTEESILRAIGELAATSKRLSFADAKAIAEAIGRHLEEVRGIRHLEVAGSFRRRKETVGDLDFLVTCDRPGAVMDRLAEYDPGATVLARGETKLSLRLGSGLQVDLRIVPDESYGAALQYFTGSQAHNVALRSLAQGKKLKINEYGVFRGKKRIAGRSEKEIYEALGLALIPPELREGRDELPLAARDALPRLVETSDLRGDLHMHTQETDGRATLEEMVRAARARGYEYIAITDHSQRVAMAHGLDAARLRRQWKRIDRLNATLRGFRILKGIELDILDDGSLDLPDEVLRHADWVIASLHYGQRQSRAQITRRLVAAIRHPYVCAIAHPTGRLIGRRPPYAVDLDTVMRAAADHGVALEVNGQPDRLDLDDHALVLARERGVVLVVDSDAHSTAQLANVEYGIHQARRGGLTAAHVVNTRSLAALRALVKHAASAA